MEKSRKPKIRFKGFTDDWEQRKLGQLASSFEYGLNAASKSYDGINKYIRITDIDDETRTFLDTDLTSPYCDLSLSENYLLKDGDILFARTGASVGKTFIYKAFNGVVYYAGFLIRARLKENCSPQFVFYNTLTKEYEKFIRVTSQRSGQPGVNAHEYATFELRLPKYDEQCEIGKFFTNLDHLITLHQRKLEKLMNVKKSMLEKMFPKQGSVVPKIRFCGFTDAWEQRELGELILEYKKTVDSSCTLPVLTSSKTEGVILQEEHFGRKQQHDITGYNVLPRSFCTYRNRSDGVDFTFNVNECCDMGIISKFYPVFYGNDNDTFFLSLVLNNSDEVVHEIAFTCIGTGQKVLSFLDLQKMSIRVPKQSEQKKISTYFKQLDDLITLHQRKLEKLKNIKKSMLEKMFI